MCFWPAVSGAYVGCAVCAVSAALSSWVSFCCDCLSCTCSGGVGCLVAVFCTLLLLLFVELPWGLCCGILSPWPLVAPYPSVISRLGFFLWRLFRLGLEVLRSWLWILPSYFIYLFIFFCGGGGGLSLSLVLVLAWLLQLLFCPGNLGFLDFLLGFLYSRLPVFPGSSEWFALALRFSMDGFMVRTRSPSIFFALSLLSLLFLFLFFFSFLSPGSVWSWCVCAFSEASFLCFCSDLLSSFPRDFLLRRSCLLFFFFEVFLSAFEISFSSCPFLFFFFFGGEVWPGPSVFGPALCSVDSSLDSGKIRASVFAWAVSCSASFFSLHVVQTEPWSFFIAKKSLVVRRLF